MQNIKETFILRTEWYEAIAELNPIDQATIFKNLFLYHLGWIEKISLDTFAVKIVWKLIEPTLSRNIESYDRRRDTSAENGQKGGRGKKSEKTDPENQDKPNNNLNNLNDNLGLPQKPIESLSDSVYVSDNVSVSESESVSAPEFHTPIEKLKNYSDLSLPAPGTDTAHQLYYETEICHRHGFDIETVKDIHTAWVGDRLGQMFTMQEARQNFASYCAKWKQNNRNRHGTSSNIKQLPTTSAVNSSYLS